MRQERSRIALTELTYRLGFCPVITSSPARRHLHSFLFSIYNIIRIYNALEKYQTFDISATNKHTYFYPYHFATNLRFQTLKKKKNVCKRARRDFLFFFFFPRCFVITRTVSVLLLKSSFVLRFNG
ncbi:hypothetical protein PUN28_007851 [Cardiocondyla obscurior]|uniref:Uncharacterized protein n=1 Tax=Cardiocondyla obscurior TaxID=286306 RepID=A0AAW2FX65_9HYME